MRAHAWAAALAVLLAAAAAAAAAAAPGAPAAWRQAGAASGEVTTTWALRLPETVARRLEARLDEVSDPDSPEYGRYYRSAEEVGEHVFGPEMRERAARLVAALGGAGVDVASPGRVRVHPHGTSVSVRMGAGELAAALRTRLCRFEHTVTGTVVTRRCDGRSHELPAAARDLVAAVSPLTGFPVTRSMSAAARRPPAAAAAAAAPAAALGGGQWPNACTGDVKGLQCGGWITPKVLADRYMANATSRAAAGGGGNSTLAFVEFSGELYNPKDLAAFSQACAVEPAVRVSRFYGDEGQPNSPSSCGVGYCSESEMDIEFGGAMAGGADLSVIYDSNYDLLAYVTNASAMASPPLVQSVSYGLDESSQPLAVRVNQEFQALGLRGVTVVVASGDDGVYGRQCTGGAKQCATFPATAPHAVSVGGTFFTNNRVGDESCTGWSGGGFSAVFAAPSYQRAAVSEYLSRAAGSLPPASFFNASARAYPDVSALSGSGNPYCVYLSGTFQSGMGTSASAPVFAGVLARVNAARAAAGRPPLGFVNPLLYKNPGAFHDVVRGQNSAGGEYGFEAAAGFDPCSGLGTPRLAALERL